MRALLILLLTAFLLPAASLNDVYKSGKIVIDTKSALAKEADLTGYDIIIPLNSSEVLISQTKGKNVKVVNIESGKVSKSFTVKNRAYDLAPNNQLVCGDGTFGKIYLYDLATTKLLKTIKVDYMFSNLLALDNNTIVINAGLCVKNGWKSVIIKKDLTTLKEIQLNNFVADINAHSVVFTNGKSAFSINTPYSKDEFYLDKLQNKQFIVGRHLENRASIYNSTGNLLTNLSFDFERKKISEDKKQEFKQKAISTTNDHDFFKSLNIDPDEAKNRINNEFKVPDYLPYYYNMIIDSDNNILLFVYTDNDTSVFKAFAYDNNSKLIGDVEIEKNGYKINMNPKLANLIFVKNSIVMFVEKDGKNSLIRLNL